MPEKETDMNDINMKKRIPPLLAGLRDHLENGIIPFWMERALDKEFGGYMTNFNENGAALAMPEKYLNTQVRLLWWFSRLLRAYPARKDFRKMADAGADFIIKYFWDAQNGGDDANRF